MLVVAKFCEVKLLPSYSNIRFPAFEGLGRAPEG